MASTADLILRLIGKDESASAAIDRVSSKTTALGTTMGTVGSIASGFLAAGAIEGAVDKLGDFVKAANEDAASVARLQQAVENSGASYGRYSTTLDDVIKKGQELGFSDESTRNSLSLLTAQTGSVEEAMRRYALAQDLSRGTSLDLETASRLLGKVTEENVTALQRYGISVQKGSSDTELFAAVYQKFHGQAQAFADSTAGQMARVTDQFHEAEEAIGRQALPTITIALKGAAAAMEGFSGAMSTAHHIGQDGLAPMIVDLGNTLGIWNKTTVTSTVEQERWLEKMKDTPAALAAANAAIAGNTGVLASNTAEVEKANRAYEGLIKSGRALGPSISEAASSEQAFAVSTESLVAAHNILVDAQKESIQSSLEQSLVQKEATLDFYNSAQGAKELAYAKDLDRQITDKLTTSTKLSALAQLQEKLAVDSTAEGYRDLVDEAKVRIQESELMQRAETQAEKELGVYKDTADKATASTVSLGDAMKATGNSAEVAAYSWDKATGSLSNWQARAGTTGQGTAVNPNASQAYSSGGGASGQAVQGFITYPKPTTVNVNLNAPVYGMDNFNGQVQKAVATGVQAGGLRGYV